MKIDAIFATDGVGGFGYEKTMPWPHNKKDMAHFQNVTHNTTIVMGYETYLTMPLPLPYRVPVIVTTKELEQYATINYKEFDVIDTLRDAQSNGIIDRAVLIGGLSIITKENLERCDTIYRTIFKGTFESTTTMDSELVKWLDELPNQEVLHEDNVLKIIKVDNAEL